MVATAPPGRTLAFVEHLGVEALGLWSQTEARHAPGLPSYTPSTSMLEALSPYLQACGMQITHGTLPHSLGTESQGRDGFPR